MPPSSASWRQNVKQRVLVVLACLTVWAVAIEARLVQLQVFQHDELETKARRHQQQRVPLEATRGDILDRHGQMLAFSVDAKSIIADPDLVQDAIEDGGQGLCRSWGLQREGTEGARGEAVTFDALCR